LWQILLQKSKIECPRKSRESRFLGISIGARILGADAKVRGRFYVKRYGPSRREARDASAALKISVHHPKNTFATKSARNRHATVVGARLLLGEQRTWLGRALRSEFDPQADMDRGEIAVQQASVNTV
jgi:hypothetical protein